MIVKAIARITQYVTSDHFVGMDYDLAILDSAWNEYYEGDSTNYVEYANDGDVEPQELAYTVADNAAKKINAALVLAAVPTLATCTASDVLVPGLSDVKLFPDPVQNIFAGVRTRVRRIPRTLNSVILMTEAQQTIDTQQRKAGWSLNMELKFQDTFSTTKVNWIDPLPTLTSDTNNDLEYRAYLFTVPPDVSSINNAKDYIPLTQLDNSIPSKPILSGSKAYESLHPDLQAGTQIHVVLGLYRAATGSIVVPSDAGTIQNGKIFWYSRSTIVMDPALVPGLKMWYAPSSLTGYALAALISLWNDTSGSGLHATQSSSTLRPVKQADGSARFIPGNTKHLQIPYGFAPTDSFSVFFVTKNIAVSGTKALMGADTTGFALSITTPSGKFNASSAISTAIVTGTTTALPTDGLYHVVEATFIPASKFTISVDGSPPEIISHAVTLGTNKQLRIGGNGLTGTTEPYDGYMKEVIVYTGQMNDITRQMVTGYLAWKHGIPLATTHPWYLSPPVI
jgi:concanavalin A-like lectin/glucanase superfamily protein